MNQLQTPPTGEQFEITREGATAIITELAASLRYFSIDGTEVVEAYAEDALPSFAAGIVLVPWPNRIEDGVWSLDGKQLQLDITEVDKNNAIHGLLRNTGYRQLERTEGAVTLGATVHPQHGYPFHLETTVRYELVDGGMDVTHTIKNLSAAKAPVAVGTHPFFKIGDVPIEQLELTVHASTYLELDARLLPVAEHQVDGTSFDFREPKLVGDRIFDNAFGAVKTVHGASAELRAPDGRTVRLLQDDSHPYVQVFTTPKFAKVSGSGLAIALEPMTAAPNAFNSGDGLRWVEPGATWTLGWGIRYSA
ncbi:aldose 1-epimerase family protein [Salinibacterium sp. G-O1]|uniref:aldose 1-epimerase family protein n=1 Tax=Salinibacterium sp. G-O1 TaxID=3046208 RepID=UPI0024BA27EB|nr:aldose 1-epimerase family protein [Salinibacterium sp. G-O1]MDJ0335970.1 aldose 1-epimerase family protein [Salinibacterium sp. G-O1]